MKRLSRDAQECLDDVYDALRLEQAGGPKAEQTLKRRESETSIKRAA